MRAVLWMGSVVMALAVIVGASRLWAEGKEKKPALRTRIGLINLTYVLKNYDKYKDFQVTMKELVEPLRKRDAELRSKLEELRKQAEEDSTIVPFSGGNRNEKATKEELEEKAKEIKKQIEDISAKVKKKVTKRSDDEMVILFKDVEEAARSYAIAHDLDLVLHYNDAVNNEDFYSAKNIARKLNTGALMRLYSKEHMDISMDLVTMLNQKMREK